MPLPPPLGTLLVVDDEPDIRFVAHRVLRRAGYDVVAVADGVSAIAAFDRDPDRYDLVVLDLSLPGLTGDAVLKRIRTRRPGVPAILSSGWAADDVENALSGQVTEGTLAKPYRPEQLLAAVEQARSAGR